MRRYSWLLLAIALLAVGCGQDAAMDGDADDADDAETSGDQEDSDVADEGDDGADEQGEDATAQGDGETYDLQFATFFGPNAPYAEVTDWWNEQVEERTDGRVTVETLGGESLLPTVEIFPGIGDGRADMGYTIEGFHHAELPLSAVASIPFITHDAYAHSLAFYELYQTNEEYRAEFEDNGVHVLYFPMGTPNILGTVDELYTALDQIEGKNIRAVGYPNQAIAAVGGNPQAMPGVEIFESLERGLLDGYTVQFDLVADWGLHEVGPNVTDPGHGQYTLPFISINKELWDSLPADIQDVMTELSVEAMDRMLDAMDSAAVRSCDAIEEAGGEVGIMDEAEVTAWEEAVGDSIYEDWKSQVEDHGIDADAFYDEYISILEDKEQDSPYVDGLHQCVERLGAAS